MLYSLCQTLHPAINDRPWPVVMTADMRNAGIFAAAVMVVGGTSVGPVAAVCALVKPFGGIDADTQREGEGEAGGPGETLR